MIHGPVHGTSSLEDADTVLTGVNQGDYSGCAVACAGDVNGDGLDDLLVGAYLHGEDDSMDEDRGMVHLVLSPVEGEFSLADADASLLGEYAWDLAGTAVAGAGDLDGDGLADFLVGAPKDVHADNGHIGRAYAILGIPSGEVGLSSAEILFIGAEDYDETGSAVACAGDVDGDGTLDVVIGASRIYHDGEPTGGAYIVLAPEPGSYDLADPDIRLLGDSVKGSGGEAGHSVTSAGDMDGDGRDDILLGAPDNSASAHSAGTVYLVSIPLYY